MLKKLVLVLSLIVLSLVIVTGCSAANASEDKILLGKEFTLRIGQSVTVSDENLVIRFDKVITDSRSPIGAQTIWAGEAKIQLQITYKDTVKTLILTEKGGTNGTTTDSFEQYKGSFKLLPYPEVGKQPAANDYELTMTITK